MMTETLAKAPRGVCSATVYKFKDAGQMAICTDVTAAYLPQICPRWQMAALSCTSTRARTTCCARESCRLHAESDRLYASALTHSPLRIIQAYWTTSCTSSASLHIPAVKGCSCLLQMSIPQTPMPLDTGASFSPAESPWSDFRCVQQPAAWSASGCVHSRDNSTAICHAKLSAARWHRQKQKSAACKGTGDGTVGCSWSSAQQ